jgi:hypothetical protein
MPRKVRFKDPKQEEKEVEVNNIHMTTPTNITDITTNNINGTIKQSNRDPNINTVELELQSSKEGEKYALWVEEGIYTCSGMQYIHVIKMNN